MSGRAELSTPVSDNLQAARPIVAVEPTPTLVIGAESSSHIWRNVRDAWSRRELLYFMTLRDLKLRYKQTALGALWTILQPLITTGVFTLVFGKVAKLGSEGIPYPLFCFAALLPWNYFANTLSRCTVSLLANGYLLNKIYLPRVLVPFSGLIPGLVDFAIGIVALLGLCWHYHQPPAWSFVWLGPLMLGLIMATVFGIGLTLGALNMKYRDVNNVLPFITQLWMLLTPIIYPPTMISEKYRWVYALNPIAPMINGFRNAVFGNPVEPRQIVIGLCTAVVSLTVGFWVFHRMERRFADML